MSLPTAVAIVVPVVDVVEWLVGSVVALWVVLASAIPVTYSVNGSTDM